MDETADVDRFTLALSSQGLHAALGYLNNRTPYRFTGVYRFDGGDLRNIKLYDRWAPDQPLGADVPMQQTFCAIVREQGDTLMVADGRSDDRFPWMQENDVVCYCGALIRDEAGEPFGTVCHFDLQRCEPPKSELQLLRLAAPHVHSHWKHSNQASR